MHQTTGKISNSGRRAIDDSVARADWGGSREYDLSRMTTEMLENLGKGGKPICHRGVKRAMLALLK